MRLIADDTQRRRLGAAFDSSALPQFILSADAQVLDCNPAAARRAGLTRPAVVGGRMVVDADDTHAGGEHPQLSLWCFSDRLGDDAGARPVGYGWLNHLGSDISTLTLLAPEAPGTGSGRNGQLAEIHLLPPAARELLGGEPLTLAAFDADEVCRSCEGGLSTRFGEWTGASVGRTFDEWCGHGSPLRREDLQQALSGGYATTHFTWTGVELLAHWAPWLDGAGDQVGALVAITPDSPDNELSRGFQPTIAQVLKALPGDTYLISQQRRIYPYGTAGAEDEPVGAEDLLGPDGARLLDTRLSAGLQVDESDSFEFEKVTDAGPRQLRAQIVHGGVHVAILNMQDVTDLRMRDREDEQAKRLESLGQLSAGVAHEINTPIQYIGDNVTFMAQAFSDLAELIGVYRGALHRDEDVSWDERAAVIAQAEQDANVDFLVTEVPQAAHETLEGVERVATIVRAMRAFGHPPTNTKAPTNVNELLRTTLVVAKSEYKRIATVETELADVPAVHADAGELQQVFLNLIVNAAHAIDEVPGSAMGQIRVRTWHADEVVCVAVTDSGCGMTPEVQERIFNPFFTTKQVGRGTGQGLNFVHAAIVERHQGTIDVQSAVNEGTTFTLRLPAPDDPAIG